MKDAAPLLGSTPGALLTDPVHCSWLLRVLYVSIGSILCAFPEPVLQPLIILKITSVRQHVQKITSLPFQENPHLFLTTYLHNAFIPPPRPFQPKVANFEDTIHQHPSYRMEPYIFGCCADRRGGRERADADRGGGDA